MPTKAPPLKLRGYSWIDACRSGIVLTFALVLGVISFFTLPIVQSLTLPTAPCGTSGPWVVRTIIAVRFGATAGLCCLTGPLTTLAFRRVWARADARMGTRYDPFVGKQPGRIVLFALGCLLLLAIYTLSIPAYLFSWTAIGPSGIEDHRPWPWTTRHYSFNDIASLENIPRGEKSKVMTSRDGPWYSITMTDGRTIELCDSCEGTTHEELAAIADFIAKQTGLKWMRLVENSD
jgi:hypothetical protein